MVCSDDYENEELRGKPNGVKAVLSERGLWQPGLCLVCPSDVRCSDTLSCCARTVMSRQPDFVAQRGLLEEYARKHCNYFWAGLQETVSSAMSSISLTTIRRFACKTQRYMDVFRKNLSGKAAEYAVKKYRSHRRIPVSVLMNVNAFFKLDYRYTHNQQRKYCLFLDVRPNFHSSIHNHENCRTSKAFNFVKNKFCKNPTLLPESHGNFLLRYVDIFLFKWTSQHKVFTSKLSQFGIPTFVSNRVQHKLNETAADSRNCCPLIY
ncbi:unnamed protein product [Albugo candida]|uniref:Uncharacterized protein n=1 Tax=Albugo candida TaxID=65357 RepID=A0A024FWV9_9STRA|nr:unnamed protein product [Albugo candida]|eukprot:CCI11476.1 unnamed protein product [Albugo candida]